eukprot:GHVL01030092.1.p1 GENE.GHVL01030092.1~~GHVL01030092.1.p1  ORF type:complete len:206 (+),score=31.80 GHVL01030092.1:214-831(+)
MIKWIVIYSILQICISKQHGTQNILANNIIKSAPKEPSSKMRKKLFGACRGDFDKNVYAPIMDKQASNRIVVVGSVNGDLDILKDILVHASLIDHVDEWIGRDAIFVQLGDASHIGPQSLELMIFINNLRADAEKHRGKVISLLGRHEAEYLFTDVDGTVEHHLHYAERRMFKRPDEDMPSIDDIRAHFGPDRCFGKILRSYRAT